MISDWTCAPHFWLDFNCRFSLTPGWSSLSDLVSLSLFSPLRIWDENTKKIKKGHEHGIRVIFSRLDSVWSNIEQGENISNEYGKWICLPCKSHTKYCTESNVSVLLWTAHRLKGSCFRLLCLYTIFVAHAYACYCFCDSISFRLLGLYQSFRTFVYNIKLP